MNWLHIIVFVITALTPQYVNCGEGHRSKDIIENSMPSGKRVSTFSVVYRSAFVQVLYNYNFTRSLFRELIWLRETNLVVSLVWADLWWLTSTQWVGKAARCPSRGEVRVKTEWRRADLIPWSSSLSMFWVEEPAVEEASAGLDYSPPLSVPDFSPSVADWALHHLFSGPRSLSYDASFPSL